MLVAVALTSIDNGIAVLVLRPVLFWPVLVIVIDKMMGPHHQCFGTDRNTVFHNTIF